MQLAVMLANQNGPRLQAEGWIIGTRMFAISREYIFELRSNGAIQPAKNLLL
jgi:hypothetical protein